MRSGIEPWVTVVSLRVPVFARHVTAKATVTLPPAITLIACVLPPSTEQFGAILSSTSCLPAGTFPYITAALTLMDDVGFPSTAYENPRGRSMLAPTVATEMLRRPSVGSVIILLESLQPMP